MNDKKSPLFLLDDMIDTLDDAFCLLREDWDCADGVNKPSVIEGSRAIMLLLDPIVECHRDVLNKRLGRLDALKEKYQDLHWSSAYLSLSLLAQSLDENQKKSP